MKHELDELADKMQAAGFCRWESRVLSAAIASPGGIIPKDIQQITGLKQCEVSYAAKRLESLGLIKSEPVTQGRGKIYRSLFGVDGFKKKLLEDASIAVGGL